jgi:hypothetical protein
MVLSFQELVARGMIAEIRKDLRRIRKGITCSKCFMPGHNRRSCTGPQRDKPLELWERALLNHRPNSLKRR